MNSLSEENYLKAVYSLALASGKKISLTAIAEELQVNTASVVDMVKKLTDKKLMRYDKVKGASLTASGKRLAIAIVRHHRLWEVFLVEKLGYTWDVVHEIAEQLEHIKHGELAERLENYLGFPEFDPHGDPIPKSNGQIPARSGCLLNEIEMHKMCRVAAVKDTSSLFLQYLEKLHISIGTRITLIDKVPFDGSLIIQIENGRRKSVSAKFASNLIVH